MNQVTPRMSAPHLSSRQLDAFLALAEQRSFTRAATLCHLSQPAFSALIRALEDDLGLRLFDRSTRHVDLTPEGQNFLESARRIRAEITSALAAVRSAATLQRGRVAVALLPSLAAGWLPGVLAQYRAAHPGIEIDIADVLSEPCIDRVASGHADFALAAIRADTPALQAEPFCSDNFYLAPVFKPPIHHLPHPQRSHLAGHRHARLVALSAPRARHGC